MNENKEGNATGRLNEDCTQMEVYCYLKVGTEPMVLGRQWIPITEEMKAKITSQNTGVVSMSAVVATPELRGLLSGSDLMLPNDALPESETVTLTPPKPYVMLSSLSEATGQESTLEEEQWSAIRSNMESKEQARVADVAAAADEHRRRSTDSQDPEHSGFNVNYYSVPITHPKRPERAPYIFEVDDLIGALNMTFNEGTILKSLIRSCTERELGLAKQGGDAIRDAQKMIHSSGEHFRILTMRRAANEGAK